MKERLKEIRKELVFNNERTVYKVEDTSITNTQELIKKLDCNRQTIANSYNENTSIYKK